MDIVLREIKRYLLNTQGSFEDDWRLYEMICCYLFNVKIWSLLDHSDKKGFLCDVGIDGYNPETSTSVQVKYYQKGSISHSKLATFYALSDRFSVKNKLLICSDESKISKRVKDIYFDEPRLMEYSIISKERYLSEVEKIKVEDIECDDFENYYDSFSEDEKNSNDIGEIKIFPKKDESRKKLRSYQRKVRNLFLNSEKNLFRVRMATGLGKSLIIYSITQKRKDDKICIIVPLISIMNELSTYFDEDDICRVGTGFHDDIDLDKRIFICVDDSWHYLSEIEFDLIIFDEAHRQYKQIREELNEDVRVLEMSATLKETKTLKLDVDYNLSWGIENGWLNEYNLELIFCDSERRYECLVKNILIRKEWLRILGFCNSLENIEKVAGMLDEYNVKYGIITSNVKVRDRDLVLKKFKNFEIQVLLSVGCLSEGVDIPEACTCLFFDGITDSDRSIQRMGRIMRKSEFKDRSFVVIPIERNIEEDLALLDFLKVIARNEGCKDVEEYVKKGKINFSGRLKKDNEKFDLEKESLEFISRVYENVIDGWELVYRMVVKWVEENDKLPVYTYSKNKLERKLGDWISKQKQSYKHKKLNNNRKEKLEKLKGWHWNSDEKWDIQFNKLNEFFINTGNLPKQFEEQNNWLRSQVRKFKKGTLSIEKEEKLNKYIPGWNKNRLDEIDVNWEKEFLYHKSFFQKNSRMPFQSEDHGYWISNQKQKQRKGTLSIEKEEKLDKYIPGWNNNKKIDDMQKWNKHFEKLKIILEETGKYPHRRTKEGTWLSNQKKASKNGTLSIEKEEKLNRDIPEWNKNKIENDDEIWYDNMILFRKFFKETGKFIPVSQNAWLSTQKRYFIQRKLLRERTSILDKKLPGWRPELDDTELKDFYLEEELNDKKMTISKLMNILNLKNIKYKKKEKKQYYIDLILKT